MRLIPYLPTPVAAEVLRRWLQGARLPHYKTLGGRVWRRGCWRDSHTPFPHPPPIASPGSVYLSLGSLRDSILLFVLSIFQPPSHLPFTLSAVCSVMEVFFIILFICFYYFHHQLTSTNCFCITICFTLLIFTYTNLVFIISPLLFLSPHIHLYFISGDSISLFHHLATTFFFSLFLHHYYYPFTVFSPLPSSLIHLFTPCMPLFPRR